MFVTVALVAELVADMILASAFVGLLVAITIPTSLYSGVLEAVNVTLTDTPSTAVATV